MPDSNRRKFLPHLTLPRLPQRLPKRRPRAGRRGEGSHLVGVRTRQKMPYGSSDSFCKMGRTKAAVLPLPVLAHPRQSRPGHKAKQRRQDAGAVGDPAGSAVATCSVDPPLTRPQAHAVLARRGSAIPQGHTASPSSRRKLPRTLGLPATPRGTDRGKRAKPGRRARRLPSPLTLQNCGDTAELHGRGLLQT